MSEIKEQNKLRFLGVEFPEVNYSSSQSYPGHTKSESKINIEINPNIFFPKGKDGFFKIIQNVELTCDGYFSLSLVAIGTFEYSNINDEKEKNAFINMNAPAIMFPYIRSFISTLTSNLGNVTKTLIIPPHFFNGKLKEINLNKNEELELED